MLCVFALASLWKTGYEPRYLLLIGPFIQTSILVLVYITSVRKADATEMKYITSYISGSMVPASRLHLSLSIPT